MVFTAPRTAWPELLEKCATQRVTAKTLRTLVKEAKANAQAAGGGAGAGAAEEATEEKTKKRRRLEMPLYDDELEGIHHVVDGGNLWVAIPESMVRHDTESDELFVKVLLPPAAKPKE